MKIEPDLWESLWPWQVATQGEGMIESWLCFFRKDNARKIPKVTAFVFFTFVSKAMGPNSIDSSFGLDKTHFEENSNQQLSWYGQGMPDMGMEVN